MLALLLCLGAQAQEAPQVPSANAPAPEEPPPLLSGPELLNFVQAPYPEEARAAGLQGQVGLLIDIDASGAVTRVEVLVPAGHGFDEAAVAAAQQFRFKPAVDATGPVPVAIEFNYGFVLDASTRPEAQPEASAPADPGPINLDGTAVEMGTRASLGEISIRVVAADGSVQETSTDAEGRWSLRGLPPGMATITAASPGYERLEQQVEVVSGQLTSVRLWLRNLSYRDNEIVGVYRKPSQDVTRRTLTVEEIRRVPGTFGDPIRVIQNLPGAARAPFGTGLLVIRGANPEDSAFYVDGIRIPLIYHLGGYSSVINPDLVKAVDYLPGGYGVEYGRSMGGVIDVSTKEEFPEGHRAAINTDLLDTGAIVEGRSGRWGYAVAGRRSYIDIFIPYFTPNPDFVIKPVWWDYQLKASRMDKGRDPLSIFFFGAQDKLIARTPAGFAQGTDPDTQGDLGTTYTTHRALISWTHPFNDQWSLKLVPSVGYDGAVFDLGPEFHIDQGQYVAEIRAELRDEINKHVAISGGVDIIAGWYNFETQLAFDPGSLGNYDPLAEREPWSTSATGLGWGPDFYLEAELRPLADPDALIITPGLRSNFVRITSSTVDEPMLQILGLDPRIALKWKPTATGTLKAGIGYYHQPPQPFEAWRPEGTVDLDFERALATELGWEQLIGEAISADISLFYKDLDSLIVENNSFEDLSDAYFTNEGIGRIYGTELMVKHAPVDRFFGWLSYTLSRSERNDYPDQEPQEGDVISTGDPDAGAWYPFDFDQTHILVAVAGYRLPRDIELSAKFQYVTGNPYTPYSGCVQDLDQDFCIPYATGLYNSERQPPFIAADARIDKLWTFKKWQLNTFLDLLNVVRGTNPEFVLYNYDYTESTYIRGLPFIPSPGFEAEFHF